MKMPWKTIGSMVMIGAFAGGAGDEGAAAPGQPGGPPPEALAKVKGGGGPAATKDAPAPTPDGKKTDDAPKVEGPKGDPGKTSSAAAKLTADELAAIKELPSDEQAVAEKQVICPVSDHSLGSMGKPLKVSAEGRTFYLCCKGCEKELTADPKAIIAKLDKPSSTR
jgi:hypothetical protein